MSQPLLDPAKVEAIKNLAMNGLSKRKIAVQVGVSQGTVQYHTKGLLKPRPKNETVIFNGFKYSKHSDGWWQRTTKPRTWLHRDVWEFHNGPIPEGYTINHIDHDRDHNDISNLEMLTYEEHGRETGRWHRRKKSGDVGSDEPQPDTEGEDDIPF
jgi:hypothetical protein